MKLLEAAGVMCVAILHASPHTHTRTYMPHTGSLSLAGFFFFSSEGQMALYLSVSVYQCVSVFVFVLACPPCAIVSVKLPVVLLLHVCLSSISLSLGLGVLVSVTTSQPVSLTHCFSYWPFLVSDVSGFWAGFHDRVPFLMSVHLGP